MSEQPPIAVGRIYHQGWSHGCGPGLVTTLWTLFTCSLTGNNEGSKGPKVPQVKPTLTLFPTNSIYTSVDNTPLHFISIVCHPWGVLVRCYTDQNSCPCPPSDFLTPALYDRLLHLVKIIHCHVSSTWWSSCIQFHIHGWVLTGWRLDISKQNA